MPAPLSHVLVSGDEGSGSDLVSGQVTAANTVYAEASSIMHRLVSQASAKDQKFLRRELTANFLSLQRKRTTSPLRLRTPASAAPQPW